ncbi:MAG: class I SAM-dependent methyltransferase [Planctomycetaceae bacterium]|nr:class I SAM-dependent methyltransferase [Planctomycetaceae bacterium]
MTESKSTAMPTPFDDGELYDVMMSGVDYDMDCFRTLAREACGPVLDFPCGTGRVLLPLLQEGIDIEGVDLSPAMLTRLRQKADALGLQPRLHQASMTDFRLDRQFALIVCPCNSFCHNLTTDEQLESLRRFREHLLPRGLLVIDSYFPGAEYINTHNSRVLEGEITHPTTGHILRMYDSRMMDRVKQIQHSDNEVEEFDKNGRLLAIHPSSTDARWTYKAEMELLLRITGFSRWEIYNGYDRRPLELETDGMVVFTWK